MNEIHLPSTRSTSVLSSPTPPLISNLRGALIMRVRVPYEYLCICNYIHTVKATAYAAMRPCWRKSNFLLFYLQAGHRPRPKEQYKRSYSILKWYHEAVWMQWKYWLLTERAMGKKKRVKLLDVGKWSLASSRQHMYKFSWPGLVEK